MAEKEERIFITKIQPECKFRELHETTSGGHTWIDFMCGKSTVKNLECDEKCFEQCEWKELTGISSAEAIERMAKALIRADYPHAQESVWDMRWDNPASKDYYLIMANSALNALLGE